MSSLAQTVVIDNGDGLIKAGFAGSDSPTTVFSTRIGKSKENTFIGNFKENDLMDISYPIERQTIKNWEDMEIIWKYTFDKLGIKSEEYPLLITEPPLNPKVQERKRHKYYLKSLMFQLCIWVLVVYYLCILMVVLQE